MSHAHPPETCNSCEKWSKITCQLCKVPVKYEKGRWIDHTIYTLKGEYTQIQRLNHAALCFEQTGAVIGPAFKNTNTEYDHKPDSLVALVMLSE